MGRTYLFRGLIKLPKMDDALSPSTIFTKDLGSNWTQSDTARELASLGLLGIDWAQTRTTAKNPNIFSEANKFLGPHPSLGKVNNYFAAMMAGHAYLANVLPPEYRKYLQYGTIGLEGYVSGKNKMLGVGMTF